MSQVRREHYGRNRTVPFAQLLMLLSGLIAANAARAVEPARQFLDALRERGYYDQALEYLDQMATSPLAPIQLKETLALEKGITLIEASRTQRDTAVREKYLNDAHQLLQQFIQQRSDHPQAGTARGQLGNLIVERARIQIELSKKSDRARHLADARQLYEQAFQVFTQQRASLKSQLDAMPKFLDDKDPRQRQLAERRDQLRKDYLQSRLLSGAIREEMTDTVAVDSQDYQKFLTEAAAVYDGIYTDYPKLLAGLYARMYQARCLQKLKKFKEALGHLSELLDQDDSLDAFRTLKTKALKYAMECWLDPSERKYLDVILRGTNWIGQSRPSDDRDPEWLVLRMYLARALVLRIEELKKTSPADKTINSSLAEARRQANFVARYSSDVQKEAQALVAQLGGPDRTGGKGEAKSFVDARDYGKEAIDAMQTATLLLQQLPARVAAEKDTQAKAVLQKQLDDANKSLAASQQEALNYFRTALRMVDSDTPLNDLNMVRYFLSYLFFTEGDYYPAALTGEFVARRYPDHSAARQCAKIAMASYLKLYTEASGDDKGFETNHVIASAEYIATLWPDQPEAEEALSTLVPFMINAGQLDRASAFLDRIPASSDKRGEAELKTGQAVWATYLRGMQEVVKWEREGVPMGVDITARKTQLEALKSRALEVLASGYSRVQQASSADRTSVLAFLSLAQVYVDSQQPLEAIEVLEHTKLGPLTLVEQKHPAAAEQGIIEEAYKTALRAYIGGLSVASDRAVMLAKAQDTIVRMRTAIGAVAGGQERLVAVFISLARNLEEQLKIANPQTKAALSQGFESFLKQIRDESNDFSVLNWVAETFMSLGAGFDTTTALSPEATHYYQESRATFDKILAGPKPAPQLLTQVQLRLAAVARKQRDFKTAIDTYVKVLTENNMLINVQVEAAKTYQEWAAVPTKELLYDRAISGHYPGKDGRNIIWGWGRIVQTTARYAQFRDTFHDANINLALCRLLAAEKKDAVMKDKLLASAFNGVAMVRRLYPDLGGPEWTKQYDTVVKRIQKSQGKQAVGLDAIPPPTTPSPSSAQAKAK